MAAVQEPITWLLGRFIVLENQYGRRDVMWIRSICSLGKDKKNAKARGKGWKRLHCSLRFEQSDRAIKELKQRQRGRQRERQKSNRFRLAKQQHLHVHHAFLCISFPLLHDYNVKMPNFTFWGGRELKTTTFFSFSWISIQPFRIQIQKKLPTFDELNKME